MLYETLSEFKVLSEVFNASFNGNIKWLKIIDDMCKNICIYMMYIDA